MSQPGLLLSSDDLMQAEIANLRGELQITKSQYKILSDENSRLKEMLLELKRERFGRRSERWESEEQIVFQFNEVEQEAKKADPEESASPEDSGEPGKTDPKKKSRGKRKPLPKHLEREVVKIELPPEECFSEDGTPLKVIGYEISEKLEYEPAKTKVIEYHRAKYGAESGDYVKTAPPVPSIIPKGIATAGLLAGIAVSKFSDGLPLYRQEEVLARSGVDLSRTTMARWMVKVAQSLTPIWNVLCDRLVANFYVSCDETRTQVLKEKGRKAESKSWMWVRSTPFGPHKIVLFDYSPSRAGDVAVEILDGFKGYLQVDGYAGYNKVSGQEGVERIGCAMHARRYFEKAFTVGANAGKTLAETGLKYFKDLFDLEEELKEKPPDERYRQRLERAQPIWEAFKAWVDNTRAKVPPTSKTGKAFAYFTSEYDYLTGYLKDGRLEMDSGFVERCIRKFAIGRNNWLFSDTEDGAHASAQLYSFVVTAKVNGVNPYRALKYILERIPTAQTLEDIEYLADIITGAQPIP
jgi:transposase